MTPNPFFWNYRLSCASWSLRRKLSKLTGCRLHNKDNKLPSSRSILNNAFDIENTHDWKDDESGDYEICTRCGRREEEEWSN